MSVPLGRQHSQQPNWGASDQCTEHRQQTGGPESHHDARKLQPCAIIENWWDTHGNPMTWVQLLMATGCEEGTGKEGEVEGLPSMPRIGLSVKICLWRTAMWVKISDQGNEGNFMVLGSNTGCLIKGSLLMKPFCSSYRRHYARRLLSCWGTSTVLISAGKVAQWAVGNPTGGGDSWNAWRITSWPR